MASTAFADTHPLRAQGTIEAFVEALDREAHILVRYPGLVWPQLHNRLQWQDGTISDLLGRQRDHRTTADSEPEPSFGNRLP